jgi:hypothetical protein
MPHILIYYMVSVIFYMSSKTVSTYSVYEMVLCNKYRLSM